MSDFDFTGFVGREVLCVVVGAVLGWAYATWRLRRAARIRALKVRIFGED